MVMGIIGNTQGVKMDARPMPNATARNASKPSAGAVPVDVPAGPGAAGSEYPAGMITAAGPAAGSTVNVAAPVHFDGTHILGLQVWKRAEKESSAAPAGASFFSSSSSRNVTSPS